MKKHIIFFLIILSAGFTFSQSDFTALYDEAYKKYQAADYEGAKKGFEAAVKANPTSSNAHYMVGFSKYLLGQYQAAISDFSNSIRYKDGEYDAYHTRGMCYFFLGKYQEAVEDYNVALNLKSDYALSYLYRGASKYFLAIDNEAMQDLNMAVTLNPNSEYAYYYRGLVKYQLKKDLEAVEDFTKSIQIKPFYDSYYYRGAAYYRMVKDAEALQDFNMALALNPKSADAFYFRGLVKYNMAKDEEAIEDFTKSINIKPLYDAYYYRGAAKYMMKNYSGAVSDYAMSATLKPDYWQAWQEKGMANYMLAKDDEAISNFSKAIELNASSGKAYYYRGQSKSYKGDKAGSLADIKKAQQLGYSVTAKDNAENSGYSATKSLNFLSNSIPSVDWLNPILDHMNLTEDNMLLQVCLKSSETITSAKLTVNGSNIPVIVTPQPNNSECRFIIKQNILLLQGSNAIKVTVTNSKGESTTESRTVIVNKALAAKEGEKRIALIIGNAGYSNGGVLKNPVNDAELMASTLSKLGFDVIKRTNADKKTMEEAIREFSKKLPNYNVVLFYYAGHGMQIDGVNYLLPVDVKLQDKSDTKFEAVSVNFVVEELERYPANTSIVILDACRNNPFRSFGRGGEQGFRAIPPASGTIISFATSEGSTASDGTGNNGLYTEELVKQMTVPQPIESVFKKTRIYVEEKSANQQSPQEWSKLKGDFWFVK